MSNYAALIPLSMCGCLTQAGQPNVNGKVWFYVPGTTTPATVFADAAATVSVTPPVTLDTGGRFPYATYPNGIYATQPVRLLIQDANNLPVSDVTFESGAGSTGLANASFPNETTVDQMATAVGASLGGPDGKFQLVNGASTPTIQSVVREIRISAKLDFGAVGNGTTDDTAALQNALTYAGTLGGKCRIYIGGGSFKTSSPLILPNNLTGVTIEGAGPAATAILPSSSAFDAFDATGAVSLTLRGLQFSGQVSLVDPTNVLIDRSLISSSGSYGLSVTKSTAASGVQIRNSSIGSGSVAGLLLSSVTGGASGLPNAIINSTIGSAGTAAIQIAGTTGNLAVTACAFSGGIGVQWLAGATGTNFTFRDSPTLGALATPFDVSALSADPGITQGGCGLDFLLIDNLNATEPNSTAPSSIYGTTEFRVTSGSSTRFLVVTAPTPTPAPSQKGKTITTFCYNVSGGSSVTFAFNGAYQYLIAAPSGANGSRFQVTWMWDGTLWLIKAFIQSS